MLSTLLPSQLDQAKKMFRYDKAIAQRYIKSINRYNSGHCVFCNSSKVVSLSTSKNSKKESEVLKFQCQSCKKKF